MTQTKPTSERNLRFLHRSIMVIGGTLALWVGITGTIIQAIDIRTVLSHPPAQDPTMQSIRDGLSGPPNFLVIQDTDYSAPTLPRSFDVFAAVTRVVRSARGIIGLEAVDFVELRMHKARPVGLVQSGGKLRRFDANTGALLATNPAPPLEIPSRPGAFRDTMKSLHRMVFLGSGAMYVELATTILLAAIVLSGLALYLRMLIIEFGKGRRHIFWRRGELWRSLHRSVALIASSFLLVVASTGFLLAVDTIGGAFYLKAHGGLPLPGLNGANPLMTSAATPLQDAHLTRMLNTTMWAARQATNGAPIRVIRLRNYANMPQGVVVSGEDEARQLVYNASTGKVARLYEPGYPETPFPFGWHQHETVKLIHRGDYFGLTGRSMDLLTGASLVFLALTGLLMYLRVWRQRRKVGRTALFWR